MNSFFGLGPMELFLILFIALVVLGPQRLPGTIREVMKYWRYFRNLSGELTSQLGEEFKDLEDLNPQKMLEGLASELDDEVERTQEAAGVKKTKKTTKSSTTKTSTSKSSTPKTSTAKSSATTTKKSTTSNSTAKPEPDVEPLKRGESLVEESVTAAAGTGVAASSTAGSSEAGKNGEGEQKAVAKAAEPESSDGVLADLERSILPPSSNDASNNAGQPRKEKTSNTTSDHVATDTKQKADSANTNGYGAANKFEDEG